MFTCSYEWRGGCPPPKKCTRLFSTEEKNYEYLPTQLVINSTPENIIFDYKDLAVLKLPKFLDMKNTSEGYYNPDFTNSTLDVLLKLEPDFYNIKFYIFINTSVLIEVYNFDYMSDTHLNLTYGSFGYINCLEYGIIIDSTKLKYNNAIDFSSFFVSQLHQIINETTKDVEFYLDKDTILVIEKNTTSEGENNSNLNNKLNTAASSPFNSGSSGFNSRKFSTFVGGVNSEKRLFSTSCLAGLFTLKSYNVCYFSSTPSITIDPIKKKK